MEGIVDGARPPWPQADGDHHPQVATWRRPTPDEARSLIKQLRRGGDPAPQALRLRPDWRHHEKLGAAIWEQGRPAEAEPFFACAA